MLKYIGKRIGLLVITLIVITVIVFFLMQLMPGYPKAIEAQLEKAKTPAEIKAIIFSFTKGMNAFERFGDYVKGIFHGNFGDYYTTPGQTVQQVFIGPLKYTLMITGPAFLMGTVIGLTFGFIAGYKRGKWQDITVNVVAIFFVSVPSFVLAMFLLLFGRKVGLPIDFQTAEKTGKTILGVILPILIVTITSFSTLTYYIRNEVVEVLTSDYIAIARAKGMSSKHIFFKHVLRNVSIPVISIVLPSFIGIIFGSMIIEMFFNVPGSSHVFANAINDKELYIIMFSATFFSGVSLLVQLFVDILYVLLDPRIRLTSRTGKSKYKYISAYFTRRNEQKLKKGVSQ